MAEEFYDADFPNLRKLGFRRTSEPAYYNCVAHVAGDFKMKWWPDDYDPFWSIDYWPPGTPKEETPEAFTQALATVGYQPVSDGAPETGVEKAALYALHGMVRHV